MVVALLKAISAPGKKEIMRLHIHLSDNDQSSLFLSGESTC